MKDIAAILIVLIMALLEKLLDTLKPGDPLDLDISCFAPDLEVEDELLVADELLIGKDNEAYHLAPFADFMAEIDFDDDQDDPTSKSLSE